MIRTVILAALALASAFVFSLFFSVPGFSAGLHPRCNVDWPCAKSQDYFASSLREDRKASAKNWIAKSVGNKKSDLARIARGRQLEQAMPFGAPIYPPETQRSFLSGTPRFVRGRLVCARNVNAALAARGIRGTGSALAKSFLSWGRASGPTPGAVAVFNRGRRGGHVAIVQEVRSDGTVIYLNPSSRRQAWQVGPYNRRPIAFRVAGS